MLNVLAKWEAKLDGSSKGVWTRALIPNLQKWVSWSHGEATHRLTQLMSDHGCFKKLLYKIKKSPNPMCKHCYDPEDEDDAAYTQLRFPIWRAAHRSMTTARFGWWTKTTLPKIYWRQSLIGKSSKHSQK